MWYEKFPIVFILNLIAAFIIEFILFSAFGFKTFEPYLATIMVIFTNIYNAIIMSNKMIDKTVKSLGKYYEKKIMEEVKKVVKKIMES